MDRKSEKDMEMRKTTTKKNLQEFAKNLTKRGKNKAFTIFSNGESRFTGKTRRQDKRIRDGISQAVGEEKGERRRRRKEMEVKLVA